ncbi:hypothetical protein LB505_006623 [Fusarium chuoi]|nr:hypothetical protein LB505_006623 [Fusarium chuoi]
MVEVEARNGESEASADENDDATLIASQDVQDDIEEFPATRHRRLRKPIVLSDEEEEDTSTCHQQSQTPNLQLHLDQSSVQQRRTLSLVCRYKDRPVSVSRKFSLVPWTIAK